MRQEYIIASLIPFRSKTRRIDRNIIPRGDIPFSRSLEVRKESNSILCKDDLVSKPRILNLRTMILSIRERIRVIEVDTFKDFFREKRGINFQMIDTKMVDLIHVYIFHNIKRKKRIAMPKIKAYLDIYCSDIIMSERRRVITPEKSFFFFDAQLC